MIFCGHRHIIITHCLTLALAAIRYKKYKEHSYGKVKGKGVICFNWPKNARNVTQFVWQPFSIEFQGFIKKRI
jgi:hypothetical protein